MRCNTPNILALSNDPVKGNQYIKKPSTNKIKLRLKMLKSSFALPAFSKLGNTKLSELPIANKKDGKTKSVGVKPCQLACIKGAKVCAPAPGVLKMIIKQMVIPLKTSRAVNLCVVDICWLVG